MTRAIHVTAIGVTMITLVFLLLRWRRISRTDPDAARTVQSAIIFRLLFIVALSLGIPEVYSLVHDTFDVPALPQLLQHLAALAVVYHVQSRVLHMVTEPEQARAWSRVWASTLLVSAVGLTTFYLLGPVRNHLRVIASDNALSPYVVEYQLIIVAFVGSTAGALFWIGARYARHAVRGPLRTGLRLIEIGGGLTALSLADRFVNLVVVAAGGHLPWRETGPEGAEAWLALPAVVCILLGMTVPKWGPRLTTWRRRRRLYLRLRPLWLALYRDDQDIALMPPRSAFVEALTLRRVAFHLHRRVVEIRDALIGPLRTRLDPEVLDHVRQMAADAGMVDPQRSATAEAACIAVALLDGNRVEPTGHLHDQVILRVEATDLDGDANWLAAVSQAFESSDIVQTSIRQASVSRTGDTGQL